MKTVNFTGSSSVAVGDVAVPELLSGEVLVRVLIDIDGRPSEVRILRSSGHARLDDAAIEAVRAALFRPYVAEGRARAAYVRVPVEFALRRS